jgi:hypothetical protein
MFHEINTVLLVTTPTKAKSKALPSGEGLDVAD